VLLARVLAGDPPILLADEPLQNLDPAQQLRMVELLRGCAARGVAVAVVVHDLPLARRLADRALLLGTGQVQALGPADAVLTPPGIERLFGVSVSAALVPQARLPCGDAPRDASG
jgi:iron complex transport system ATP-binding protein